MLTASCSRASGSKVSKPVTVMLGFRMKSEFLLFKALMFMALLVGFTLQMLGCAPFSFSDKANLLPPLYLPFCNFHHRLFLN
jgi:hypothetical protein